MRAVDSAAAIWPFFVALAGALAAQRAEAVLGVLAYLCCLPRTRVLVCWALKAARRSTRCLLVPYYARPLPRRTSNARHTLRLGAPRVHVEELFVKIVSVAKPVCKTTG